MNEVIIKINNLITMPNRIEAFKEKLKNGEKILLDSGLGTELQRLGIQTCLPLWSAIALFDHQDLVRKIHEDNIKAGARIITTNTFRTNRRTLAKVGKTDMSEELTIRACELAKEAREYSKQCDVLIAGSMTTVEDCYSPDLVPTTEELRNEHFEQAVFLKKGGVDFILIETMNTLKEAEIAMQMAKKTGLEVAISFCCGEDGNLLSGDDLKMVCERFNQYEPLFLATNCALPEVINNSVDFLLKNSKYPVGVYANGKGHPSADLGWSFEGDENLKSYLEYVKKWISGGVQIIGSCCGTNYQYTKNIQEIIRGK